jgi:hypothetical protein
MWIFTSKSFLSIVEHTDEAGLLHVRARFAGDIEEIFPSADVIETPHNDYRYRTSLPREKVVEALGRAIKGIDYDNFKNSVHEQPRKDAYIKVWEAMWQAQHKEWESGA